VGEEEHIYVIGGKARGKEPLGRPRHKWVDNIRMDLGEVECYDYYGLDWSGELL
jgi:hypothetical protein